MIVLNLSIIFKDIQCIPTVSRFQRDSIQNKNGILNKKSPRTAEQEKISFEFLMRELRQSSHAYRQVFQNLSWEVFNILSHPKPHYSILIWHVQVPSEQDLKNSTNTRCPSIQLIERNARSMMLENPGAVLWCHRPSNCNSKSKSTDQISSYMFLYLSLGGRNKNTIVL